jgi:hypothetical protein
VFGARLARHKVRNESFREYRYGQEIEPLSSGIRLQEATAVLSNISAPSSIDHAPVIRHSTDGNPGDQTRVGSFCAQGFDSRCERTEGRSRMKTYGPQGEPVVERSQDNRDLKGARVAISSMALVALMAWSSAGCAVHYFDAATGTDHIWGVGHLKMKAAAPDEGLRALVRGTDVVGLSFGRGDQQLYVTLGWHRTQRLDVLAEDAAVRLEWPSGDFSDVRVGSRFPLDFDSGSAPLREPNK